MELGNSRGRQLFLTRTHPGVDFPRIGAALIECDSSHSTGRIRCEIEVGAPDFSLEPALTDRSSFPIWPGLAERVWVEGYERPFFVAKVNEERHEVDLVPVAGSTPCLDGVPFANLRRGGGAAGPHNIK